MQADPQQLALAEHLGLTPPAARITEPVTLRLVITVAGKVVTSERRHDSFQTAYGVGRTDACMAGTERVVITGADGEALCTWLRTDNLWRNNVGGQLWVTENVRVCSCGGTPSLPTRIPEHLYHERTLGWYWMCPRCAAGAWFRVGP